MNVIPAISQSEKASLGSVLGAFVGDSVGSYLEFVFGVLSAAQVSKCMSMPGGGCHKVAPG